MTNITFDLKALEKQMNKKISDKLLLERVPYLGTTIEELTESTMTIDVPPNRPDLLSLPGFARAFVSFLGIKIGLQKYKVEHSHYKVIIDEKVSDVRPFTVCAVVKGLKFSEEKIKEVIDLQEKLHITYGRNRKKMALGIYPLEKISFPITYTAMHPKDISFIPLESNAAMNGLQILEEHPTGKKYGPLLEGKNVFPLFVDAKKNIMSMPPLINSAEVGKISEETTDVFIECSGFDFAYLSKALNIVVCALSDMGGTLYEVTLEYEKKKITPQLEPEEMHLDYAYVEKIIGIPLKEKEIEECLEKMGFGIDKKKILIPPYRVDVLHQIDLIEDIAIAYGYDNIPETIPKVASTGKPQPLEHFKNTMRDIAIGSGLLEIKNLSLSNYNIQNAKLKEDEPLVELESSFSEDYNVLRRHLLSTMIETFSKNTNREYPQNLFEIGTVFEAGTAILEKDHLCIGLCNNEADFTRIKQILKLITQELSITYSLSAVSKPFFIEGRSASIHIGKTTVGIIGEIHPDIIEAFNVELPIAAMEIHLNALFEVLQKKKE